MFHAASMPVVLRPPVVLGFTAGHRLHLSLHGQGCSHAVTASLLVCACVQGIGSGLPSGNCSIAPANLALLNPQRSEADAPRFIESTEIGATPTSQPSAPLRGFASGVGLRGSRMGSKGAGSSTGAIGLFAAAAGNSAALRSAFDELVDLWRLEADVKRELQDCVQRCEYQQGDVVVEQACPASNSFQPEHVLGQVTVCAWFQEYQNVASGTMLLTRFSTHARNMLSCCTDLHCNSDSAFVTSDRPAVAEGTIHIHCPLYC